MFITCTTKLFLVITIVIDLADSVASCKLARSKAKILNNYLQFATSSERLQDLVQIDPECDTIDYIKLKKLVEFLNREASGG